MIASTLVSATCAGADVAAVAQHGVAVAEAEHFLEPVGDEDDRQALGLAACGRCVARLATSASLSAEVGSSITMRRERIDSARAISTSCCSATERSRTGVIGSRLRPILSAIALGLGGELAPADEQPRARLAADEHVLGDRHVGGERELLIDRDDAGALRVVRRGEGDRLADRARSRPASALCAPDRIFSSVDLPAPFSPSSAWISASADFEMRRPRAPARRESAC